MTTEPIWLQTYEGKQLRIPEFNSDAISLRETATVLSRICRFGGRTRVFYSVAEHSIRVAECVAMLGGTPLEQFYALNHEGDEALLGFDPPSPLLRLLPDLRDLKRKAHDAYMNRYGWFRAGFARYARNRQRVAQAERIFVGTSTALFETASAAQPSTSPNPPTQRHSASERNRPNRNSAWRRFRPSLPKSVRREWRSLSLSYPGSHFWRLTKPQTLRGLSKRGRHSGRVTSCVPWPCQRHSPHRSASHSTSSTHRRTGSADRQRWLCCWGVR